MFLHDRLIRYTEYTGRLGATIDGRPESFTLDRKTNRVTVRFRLPEGIETGPWIIREKGRPRPQFHKLFQVGGLEQSRGFPFWKAVYLILGLLALLAAIRMVFKKRIRKPGLVEDRFQIMVESLKEKIHENYADKLAQTNITVNEIAFRTGFSDPSLFMQSFKKKYGITPTQWRKKG